MTSQVIVSKPRISVFRHAAGSAAQLQPGSFERK